MSRLVVKVGGAVAESAAGTVLGLAGRGDEICVVHGAGPQITAEMKRRRDDLQRLVREATARLMAQPDRQALVDLPKSEAALRAAWDGWSVAERRAWLRRILHHVAVLPADAHHRGSDVEARLDPDWRV
mgnify:CR=1 FL=1